MSTTLDTGNDYIFRRQFVLAQIQSTSLSKWLCHRIGDYYLYSHPDVSSLIVKSSDKDLTAGLIGFIIDPNSPESSDNDILKHIAELESITYVEDYLSTVSGRFVLILKYSEDILVFHDPCGLRTVYYTEYEGNVIVGSQPLIFKNFFPLKEAGRYHLYKGSSYSENTLEDWLPSGCSLYENVYHLIPNHYLNLSTLKQQRFYPKRVLTQKSVEEVEKEATELLRKLIIAGSKRFKLALSLTAGWDSRLLLCASKEIASDIYFYTLQYRNMTMDSYDLQIPRNILSSLGYSHHILDCQGEPSNQFISLYENNASMSHMEDWGVTAYGMMLGYPQDRVCIKGNCSEIARCFYYKKGVHEPIISAEQIVALEPGWKSLPFVYDALDTWYDRTKNVANKFNIDILDLFYWEHRIGSWQAQSQLEWDIVQEQYTPYNHRGLLELLLSTPADIRSAPDYMLYYRMCSLLWSDTMVEPVNPPKTRAKLRWNAKRALIRFGVFDTVRDLYDSIRNKR